MEKEIEDQKKYYQIGSLEKGMKILEAIVEHGELTVTQAAAAVGIHRPGTHRFISTLRDLGYLRKNQHNRYEPTFKLLELGMKQADKFEIRRLAKPFMRDLAANFDKTVNLGLLDQGKVLYLDKVESRELLRMDSGIGTSCPAYASALGKAMLAFLPEDELKSYVTQTKLISLTPNTIDDSEKLIKELAKIKKRGYAVDNEELAQDLYCIGAPIFDFNNYPSFAISLSGPIRRIKNVKDIPLEVMECARQLSAQLGFRSHIPL